MYTGNLLIFFLYFIYMLLCLLEENVKLNISEAAQLSQFLQCSKLMKINRTGYQAAVSYL